MGNWIHISCERHPIPFENVWDAKQDDTGEDVEEVSDCQNTHQLVEVVPLGAEPGDQADVANYTNQANKDL